METSMETCPSNNGGNRKAHKPNYAAGNKMVKSLPQAVIYSAAVLVILVGFLLFRMSNGSPMLNQLLLAYFIIACLSIMHLLELFSSINQAQNKE